MDYYLLVDLAIGLGYELAMSGAETFRVEDSIRHVLRAYGIDCEVFAIPNCLTISFMAANGKPMTRMRRIGFHGNDLEAVEQLNALSRKICAETPDPQIAAEWLRQTRQRCRVYSLPMYLLGDFLGAGFFALFFGGNWIDGLCAGICGISVGIVTKIMDSFKVNQFFSTIGAAFIAAIIAYFMAFLGIVNQLDAVIIGTLMILVPGLLFTNSMRDIIYGDTNSGINRIVQVALTAVAIALGTAAAWQVTQPIWGMPANGTAIFYPFLVHCIIALFGCVGFAIYFNVHGNGIWLCAFGGFLTWAVYLIAERLGCGVIACNFWAAITAAAYAEIMARIRKYPAISYLVVSAFPLLPGAGIYYTMSYILQGDMDLAFSRGMQTAGIAGSVAVGILLVSTIVRLITQRKTHK